MNIGFARLRVLIELRSVSKRNISALRTFKDKELDRDKESDRHRNQQ